ncbi:MAG: hypothetical protein KAJ32_02725 [Gammaproteobacteria bacterium]|nr:hypothetical protein [Gammaproteobacteria bacterium]
MSLNKISHIHHTDLSRILPDEPDAGRRIMLDKNILILVLCICMISAIGSALGLRHIVAMQFDVDRDTEYIMINNAALLFQLRQKINNRFQLIK